MGILGGLIGVYNDAYDLLIKSSQAMVALSAVALIGGAIQAIRYKCASPYGWVCAAALCLLIQAAINASINERAGALEDMLPPAMAAYFFGAIFAILFWVLLFDIFRMAHPRGEIRAIWRRQLLGTLFAYVWAFIMVICAVAFVGTFGSMINGTGRVSLSATINALQTGEFVTYGLWAFAPIYTSQLWCSWSITRHFFYSFAPIAACAYLINIGRTVSLAITTGDLEGSQAVPAQAVDFVMSRLVGVFGLYCAIAFGHRWVPGNPSPSDDRNVEQQQSVAPSADNAKTEVSEHTSSA